MNLSSRRHCLPESCYSPVRHWKSIAKWHISHHALKWQCLPWISICYVTVLKTCFLIFLFIITIYIWWNIRDVKVYNCDGNLKEKKEKWLVKKFYFLFFFENFHFWAKWNGNGSVHANNKMKVKESKFKDVSDMTAHFIFHFQVLLNLF